MLRTEISIGDLAVIVGLVGTALGNYFTTRNMTERTDYKVEELRRGRGLILEHWPPAVQRCFGYFNGNSRATRE